MTDSAVIWHSSCRSQWSFRSPVLLNCYVYLICNLTVINTAFKHDFCLFICSVKHYTNSYSVTFWFNTKGRIQTSRGHCATTKPQKTPRSEECRLTVTKTTTDTWPKKIKGHFQTSSSHSSTTPGFPCFPSHLFFHAEKKLRKPTRNVYLNDGTRGNPSADQCFKSQSMKGRHVISLPGLWPMRGTWQPMDVNVRVDEMHSLWPFPPGTNSC